VRVVSAAAAAEAGSVPFYRAPWNDAEDSTIPREGAELVGEVPALPLADLLTESELRRARVIKVDVEGGELGVLRGLRPVAGQLRRDAELAIEAHEDMLAAQGASLGDLLELLEPSGFAARELPLDISELAHLFPEHAEPAPLDPHGRGLRHVILTRAGIG
jgi:hypothetical protein